MLSPRDISRLSLPVLQLAIEAGDEIIAVYHSSDLQVEHKSDLSPLTLADRRAHDIIDTGLVGLAPETPVLSEEGREPPFAERREWNELWLVDPLDGTKEFIKGNGEFTVNIGLVQDGAPVFGVVYAPARGVAYVGTCVGDDSDGAANPRESFLPPGAFRFSINNRSDPGNPPAAISIPDLAGRAEPIHGAAPDGDKEVHIIASRSHMGLRTRAFVKHAGQRFERVQLVNIGSSLKLCMIADGTANIYPRSWPTMEWDTAAGHAIVKAAGGEVWHAPRDGRGAIPDWFADVPVDEPTGATITPVRYNRRNLRNKAFVARGW